MVYGSYGSAVHKAVVEYDALDKNTYQCIPLAEQLEQQLFHRSDNYFKSNTARFDSNSFLISPNTVIPIKMYLELSWLSRDPVTSDAKTGASQKKKNVVHIFRPNVAIGWTK